MKHSKKVGEEMAGYAVQKREAIQREDYDLAEEKRSRSEMCCQQAFKRLNVSSLLMESDPLTLNVEGSSQPPTTVRDNGVVELQPINIQDDPVMLHAAPEHHYDNQDNRPLPTLDK